MIRQRFYPAFRNTSRRFVCILLACVLSHCAFILGPGLLESDDDDQTLLSLAALLGLSPAAVPWTHQAYLKAPNNTNDDLFGSSVAISGDTLVVGAFTEENSAAGIINGTDLSATNVSGNGNGAAYVYTRSPSGVTWSHQAYLKAPNTGTTDLFGESVAISGDTIVIGARWENSSTTSIVNGATTAGSNNSGFANGAAYVFVRSGTTWSHQAYLKTPNNSGFDFFGASVAIDGDTVVVGAFTEDSTTTAIINGTNLAAANNAGNNTGAAYVFTRAGTSWSHQAYLKAPNAGDSDLFGGRVAISGDTIVVAATAEASSTSTILNGTDLSSANDAGSGNGAAYVFTRAGTSWSHQAYLKAPNTGNDHEFGRSVAIDGDTIVVGAYREASSTNFIINGANLSATNNTGSDNGAAYVFARSGTVWSHQAYLKAPNNSNVDRFGESVAISGDTIVVGASREDSTSTDSANSDAANDAGNDNGAAYVYTRIAGNWFSQEYLKSPNNSNRDEFGVSVGVSANTIVVGAAREASSTQSVINGGDLSGTDDGGSSNGAAYVFAR